MFRNLSTQGLGISGVESEIIELALTYRFKGIDPDLSELIHRAEERGVKYARRLIDSGKLQLGTYRLPVAWQEGDEAFQRDLKKLPKLAEQAAELGCTLATTVVNPACDQRPYHENFEFHRRRLGEIGQILGPAGVRLGLEFRAPAEARQNRAFEFIHTLDELRKLVSSVGQESVGVVLDVWHWHVGGGSMSDITGLSIAQIVAVQLADAPDDIPIDKLTEKNRLLPGETGVIDSAAVVQFLAQRNYEGPVTAKPDRSRFPKTGRVQIVRMASEALDQVWTAAGLPVAARPVLATAMG
jgi:sugar phosphate isomerase/epimerase